MVRESRHLWVGNLPENLRDDQIVEYFSRFGRVEKVKILPKKSLDGGLAAFVDFVDIRSATKANETTNFMADRELRTNYNEPGNHPSMMGEGRGRGRPHIYDRGRGGYGRRDRPMPNFGDEDGQRRGRYPYNDRGGYHHKRPRGRKNSGGSIDSDRPSSPKYTRTRSGSASSQSDRRRSTTPDNESYSGSDVEVRAKSGSPSRSSVGAPSQKSTSIQIKNLSTRPGDNSIKEALFHEFKKIGEILNIRIIGSEKERYALIRFKRPEDAEKSLQSNNKTFLGNDMKISVFKGENIDKDADAGFNMYRKKYRTKEPGSEDMHFDPMATRTLFVGNLDKMLTHGELRKIFEKFGDVVDVDIKKQNPGITTYAFLQYVDINGAMRAKQRMDREIIRGNRIKVGFGRGTPTNTIWIGNVPDHSTEGQIRRQFHPFGYVTRVIIDRQYSQGLVSFDTIDAATAAFENMRGRYVLGKKLLVDFASRSCKEGFYERMERTGQIDRRTLEPSPPPSRPTGPMHSGYVQSGGYSGRGRGYRGGYSKGYSAYNRYSQGSDRHAEYRDYPPGSQEYFPESFYTDDDYDDYEKELRDYGYRQRERERERETGRPRSERDSSRNRDRDYTQRERHRRRAYTPLTDEEANSVVQKSDLDEDDDDEEDDEAYSEKDIQSKIVKPGIPEKRKSEEESFHGDSPDVAAAEEVEKKVEKKEKKKKKAEKKAEKKRKMSMDKEPENEEHDVVEEKNVKIVKAEKKKKRKLSEKGLTAEEKAKKKELRKLKKLMKLQAELGRSEEFQRMKIEVEQAEQYERDAVESESAAVEEEFQLVKEERDVESLSHSVEDGEEGRDLGEVREEEDGRFAEDDAEREKLEELERKKEELRRLEEDEKGLIRQVKIEDDAGNKERDEYEQKKEDDLVEKKIDGATMMEDRLEDGLEDRLKDRLGECVKDEKCEEEHDSAVGKLVDMKMAAGDVQQLVSKDSDSELSDLIIDESVKLTPAPRDEGSSEKLQPGGEKKDVTIAKGLDAQGRVVEEESECNKGRSTVEKNVHGEEDLGSSSEVLQERGVGVKEEEVDDKLSGVPGTDDIESSKKQNAEVVEDSVEVAKRQDIYSSESDSSDNLDAIDDFGVDEVVGEAVGNEPAKQFVAKGKEIGEDIDTPMSPDRTPPTPDLEEDNLRTQMQIQPIQPYAVASYPKMYDSVEERRMSRASPAQDSDDDHDDDGDDDEKMELERSMKQANYQKRKVGEVESSADKDKKRTRKGHLRQRKLSTSSEHDSDSVKSASARRGRSPSDRKSRTADEQVRLKRTSPFRRVESNGKNSLKTSPRDSPDFREHKESRRDRGESPRRKERRRNSIEAMSHGKSPEFRRMSPVGRDMSGDRVRREAAYRDSPDWNLSPRKRRSADNRYSSQRGRDGKEVRPERGREEDHKLDERDARRAWEPDRDARDIHDARYGKEARDGRDFRDGRNFDKSFRPISNDASRDRGLRDRGYNRDRDAPMRGHPRNESSERRSGYSRDVDRPQRYTPPSDQRSRSPARYPSGERGSRASDVRGEALRPRTPEQQTRARSPVMRSSERRRGRSPERRPTPPSSARAHEATERQAYREHGERREPRDNNREKRDRVKDDTPPPPPPPPEPRKEHRAAEPNMPPHQQRAQPATVATHSDSPGGTPGSTITPNPPASGSTPTSVHFTPPPPPPPNNADSLLDLLRRYPVMWQGLFALKNDSAAVQMHYISGNARLAEASLPRAVLAGEVPPPLRISQRMKLEISQLEGVNKRIKSSNEHCMLLALPCGRDPLDVHTQTRALKTGFITYLQVKQAAGIINIVNSATKQPAYVLHIFPPCEFAEVHLARVAPDLLDSAADSGHLMVLITPA